MKKVAKLVSYSFMTRVVVDENATQDEIIRASKKEMKVKVDDELGENLEDIDDDGECPYGTFATDNPSIDRVILNVSDKQYLVIGKGLPVQVISFDSYSDWDSVQNLDGEPVFDVQIDDDECDDPFQFQYVDLIWVEKEGYYQMGGDFQGVKVEVVKEPLAQVVINLMKKSLDK